MKHKFNLITLLVVFFVGIFSFTNFAYADNVGLAWVKSLDNTNAIEGKSLIYDSNGNVYTVGSFSGTVDFDPGSGTSNLTSAGNGDIFVLKLDSDGDFVWVKQMGSTALDEATSIIIDSSDNLNIIGSFSGTVDFDPGAGTTNLTSAGDRDIFVLKLDSDGDFVWVKQMGSTGADYGLSMAIDSSNNIYTTGGYQGTVDFDPGAGTTDLTSAGSTDIFIQKLTSSGNLVWVKSVGGDSWGDWTKFITVDSNNNVYVSGSFNSTADFDPSGATYNLTSNGNTDGFVLKLDSDGDFVWAKQMGGNSWDFINSVIVDSNSDVYISGEFTETVDFDPGAGSSNLTSAGENDIFITKLDSDGEFIYVKQIGSTGSDYSTPMVIDSSNNIYITGARFTGTVDFDPGAGTYNLTSNGAGDNYLLKINSDGEFIYVKQFGGTGADIGSALSRDTSGNIYIRGNFTGTVDFDPSSATTNLTSAGATDIFILKLTPIIAPTLTTSTSSNTTRSSTTLSGSITTTGYEPNTTRGFQYGLSAGYGSTTTETGTFDTGSYQGTISNLNCATTYHYRAYSSNSEYTGYGSDSTFTTSECPGAVSVAFLASLNKPSITPIYTPTPITQPTTTTVLCQPNDLFNPNTGERCTTYTNNQTNNTNTKFTFNINLKYKDTNNDVKELQKFLNTNGYTVSTTGPGSLNNETTYFGPATLSAVIKYQKAKNITPSVGYFGPLTRASVNN